MCGGFLQFEMLADFVSLGALVGFTLVAAGAIELRYRERRSEGRCEGRSERGSGSSEDRAREAVKIGRSSTSSLEVDETDQDNVEERPYIITTSKNDAVATCIPQLLVMIAGGLVVSYAFYKRGNDIQAAFSTKLMPSKILFSFSQMFFCAKRLGSERRKD